MLLGHYLGILQAPLGSCSSQALQLVSVGREGRRVEEEGLVGRGAGEGAAGLTLLLLLGPPRPVA